MPKTSPKRCRITTSVIIKRFETGIRKVPRNTTKIPFHRYCIQVCPKKHNPVASSSIIKGKI